MGCSRGLMTWSAKLAEMAKQESVKFFSQLEAALDYTWNHFEHQIDAVKYNTKVESDSLGFQKIVRCFVSFCKGVQLF